MRVFAIKNSFLILFEIMLTKVLNKTIKAASRFSYLTLNLIAEATKNNYPIQTIFHQLRIYIYKILPRSILLFP